MKTLATICILFFALNATGQSEFGQAKKLVEKSLQMLSQKDTCTFNLVQAYQQFGHYSKPWETKKYDMAGSIMLTPQNEYYRKDSLKNGTDFIKAYTLYDHNTLFQFDYGAEKCTPFSVDDKSSFLDEIARYTPKFYLLDFLNVEEYSFLSYQKGKQIDTITYKKKEKIISLVIDNKTTLVNSILVLYNNELMGDVLKEITYSNYISTANKRSQYASKITEVEFGITLSSVTMKDTSANMNAFDIKNKIPKDYKLVENSIPQTTEITYRKYNDYIHILHFKEAVDNVIIVEFKDFLTVVGAPLNTENGELIINKAKEIMPNKPIKYFVFGHHHPYYLGGIRAFVHNNSSILCLNQNVPYIKQLTSFKHSLKPDILEKEPKELKLETFDSLKTISDGTIEMQIIKIGMLSNHAEDFSFFYFPQDNILFEDELIWMSNKDPMKPANKRQKGLYEAIAKHKLVVDTILQSWPGEEMGFKETITFKELEESINMIPKKN